MPHIARERYSELVDAKLRATIVKRVGVICNNRYEGSPKAGAVKVPVRDTEVTVADYNKKTGTTMTHGDTSFLTVNIDKDKAVNELIDGFDAESVPGHLVADRLDSAGYSLALQMETDASAELVTGGTAMDSTAALTKANIYDTIVDARTKLSETHVPTDGRWLLVSPETYALLLKSPEFIKASALGFIAGHPNWFTRIEEWSEPVAVNDLKGSGTFIGACAVQGRKIYAHKVTKAQTVLVKSHA